MILSKAVKNLCADGTVSVCIQPKPDNEYDWKAIAFQCYIEGKWKGIYYCGYVVKECLEHVNKGLRKDGILSVKLAWAKYQMCWSYTGPGY